MPHNPKNSDAPGMAVPKASEPKTQLETEKGSDQMVPQNADIDQTGNPYRADSMTRQCCGGVGRHAAHCDLDPLEGAGTAAPVELDTLTEPRPPAIIRWHELADRDYQTVHDGDAQAIIPFARPSWADEDCDIVGRSVASTYFTSTWAEVPLTRVDGYNSGDALQPATVRVRAKLSGDGCHIIGLSDCRVADGAWKSSLGVSLTPAEATELARVLLAAVDLIGGDK